MFLPKEATIRHVGWLKAQRNWAGGGMIMTKSLGRLAVILLAATIALPLSANAQKAGDKPAVAAPAKSAGGGGGGRPGGGGGGAPHISGGGGGGAPHINNSAPHISNAARINSGGGTPHIERATRSTDRAAVRAAARTAITADKRAAERAAARAALSGRQIQTQTKTANVPLTRAELRRELRALPPAQRAARREELRQQRANALSNRQTPTNLTSQSSTRVRSANRLNGQARITQQAARQGRFAARLANASANTRNGRWAAHEAWRYHRRAGFVPWYGPVFWPYAYSDIFDYAFWPDGYDEGYWDYAYDDFVDGLFWGQAGPPEEYVEGGAVLAPRASVAGVQQLCQQPGSGVTAWPVVDIQKKVGLNDDQKQLLADVKSAGEEAAKVFKASCPNETAFPLTPPGRLNAMTARLDATLEAVQAVRPPLEKFYASLSDEQRERFNQIGPQTPRVAAKATTETTGTSATSTDSCKQPKAGLTNLPMESIEDAVKPTQAQQDELKNLEDATAKAVSIMQAACPDEIPLTPPGRLEAMEKRLQAMSEAGKTVKPALDRFYASLSNEQKARFDRIGGQLAQSASD
jgi:hypothetical protein